MDLKKTYLKIAFAMEKKNEYIWGDKAIVPFTAGLSPDGGEPPVADIRMRAALDTNELVAR